MSPSTLTPLLRPLISSQFDIVAGRSIADCAGAASDRADYAGLICTLSTARLSHSPRSRGKKRPGAAAPDPLF